ncbi:MAG: hypothetical protein ACO3F7_04425 [Luteolibacter sp.]
MKQLLTLAVVCAAIYFGYKHEPDLRYAITGIPYEAKRTSPSLPNIDLTSLRPNQLPQEITIFHDIRFKDPNTGLEITATSGSKVQPVKITPPDISVRVKGTNYLIKLPIHKTDLAEQLASMPLHAAPAPVETAPTTPTPPPVQAAPTPEPVAPSAPSSTVAASSGSLDPVKLMRDSLQIKPTKEFGVSQITDWSAGPTETIDGETYDTGIVSYEATTILGQKTMRAKALIKNGHIEKWIHAKSGVEIE